MHFSINYIPEKTQNGVTLCMLSIRFIDEQNRPGRSTYMTRTKNAMRNKDKKDMLIIIYYNSN